MSDGSVGGWECKYLGDHTHWVLLHWHDVRVFPLGFSRWRIALGARARMTPEGYECIVYDEELAELKRILESQPLRMFPDEREREH